MATPRKLKDYASRASGSIIRILAIVVLSSETVLMSGSAQTAEQGQQRPSTCLASSCCDTYDSLEEDRNSQAVGLGELPKRCGLLASTDEINGDIRPCEHPEYWPYTVASERYPVLVHYRRPEERAMAMNVVKYVDTAWKFEVDQLGFAPPLPDGGFCGPDGSFDVFLWRGRQSCWVDEIAGSPSSVWGGRMSYMAVDPWGRNGREILRTTIGHEFNHASQAADNWDAPQSLMEMSATYVEQYFGDALLYNIRDFQLHPEYAVLWLDLDKAGNLETYHMYGAGLYVYFLRDRYFSNDATFLSRLWSGMRNPDHPAKSARSSIDALDDLLTSRGSSYAESMLEFARWRFYSGSRDDGRHFRRWPVPFDQLPFLSASDVRIDGAIHFSGAPTSYSAKQPLMIYGSAYVDVISNRPDITSIALSMKSSPPPGSRWVVQAVPGLPGEGDGEIVKFTPDRSRVTLVPAEGGPRRTLIFMLVNEGGRYDPARQDDSGRYPYFNTYPLTFTISP